VISREREFFAELVGLAFGDGSLTKRKNGNLRFQLRGDANEDKPHYLNHIAPMINHYLVQPLLNKNISFVEAKKPWPSFGVAIESNIVCEFLNNLGIPIGRKTKLAIPFWIVIISII